MKLKRLFIFFVLFFLAVCLLGNVSGYSLPDIKPVVTLTSNTQETNSTVSLTAVAVDSMVNIRYNGFCKDLSKAGIQKENIFLDMISLVPVFEMQVEKKLFSKTYNEVPVGFKLEKNIHVHYKKGEEIFFGTLRI